MVKPKVIAFLSRQTGLNVLQTLAESREFDIPLVLTHRYEATQRLSAEQRQGPRPERAEYRKFIQLGKTYGFPLTSKGKSDFAKFTLDTLAGQRPDFVLSVNYWFMVPEEIFTLANIAALNIHPSVSANGEIVYKGLSPIDRALADGNSEMGVSIHRLTKECDFGEVLDQRRVPINPKKDSVRDVYQKLMPFYRELALKTLLSLYHGAQYGR